MKRAIPALPYRSDALEPTLSSLAIDVHYGRHHKGYAEKLEKLVRGTPQEEEGLEALVRSAEGDVFNNAAQVWNHTFYWNSMRPDGGGRPEAALLRALEDCFGSFERFRDRFAKAANDHFGSGWAWLVRNTSGQLEVCSTADADNPLRRNCVPLLVLDVWEHAYYLDYRNERSHYVSGFLDHLVSWRFAAENLAACSAVRSLTRGQQVASAQSRS